MVVEQKQEAPLTLQARWYKRFGRRARILRVHEVYGRNRANVEVECVKRNSRKMETKIALHECYIDGTRDSS